MSERVLENLNRALHSAMANDPGVFLIGEDLADPYGGAFKISRGLSTAFPDRVISTPVSENGIAGVANGLALAAQKPILEFMFGDFALLAFDQIVNFAAKSVSMYGDRLPFHLLIRCPVGGNRGYGATHSQSLQKHFIGVPDLHLFEISPLHDNTIWLPLLLHRGHPCMLFESKTLYPHAQLAMGQIDDFLEASHLDGNGNFAHVYLDRECSGKPLLLCTGGMVPSCLAAMRTLLLEHEIEVQLIVPFQIYPFDPNPLHPLLDDCKSVYVVEESTAGGTWGAEVAMAINSARCGKRMPPVALVHSLDKIIPSARHLENQVLVQPHTIVQRIVEDATR